MRCGKPGNCVSNISFTKNGGRIVVSIGDEKLVFSRNTFTDFHLYVGKKIDEKEYILLKKAIKDEEMYGLGLRLALKGKSRFEIKERLLVKEADEAKAARILRRLKEEGHLDEFASAQNYVDERQYLGYGKKRILAELAYKRKFSPEVISRLSFKEESGKALELAEMAAKKYSFCPYAKKVEKVMAFLIRKGYSPEVAHEVSLKTCSIIHDPSSERKGMLESYRALKRRYEGRYEGSELERHLYEGMRKKGYTHKEYMKFKEECGNDFD